MRSDMNVLLHCAGTGGQRGVGEGGGGNFLDARHFVQGCKLQILVLIRVFRSKCQLLKYTVCALSSTESRRKKGKRKDQKRTIQGQLLYGVINSSYLN